MTGNRVCWYPDVIANATQVDVGGLEVGDVAADATFAAIHQPLPIKQTRGVAGGSDSTAHELDVLRELTRPIRSNEPLLLFITGQKGTGKSHLVRWLHSRIGSRPTWNVVYIEKRNTDLRRVIERILDGIDTPRSAHLRDELAKAGTAITSDEEAMHALLSRLDHLVTFDQATELRTLPQATAAEIANLRQVAHRLLGDFTFRAVLSAENGPIHRMVRLARGASGDTDVDEADLHLTEDDFRVDVALFEEAGPGIMRLVRRLGNSQLRTEIAALCNSYLERAKAEVFTGPSTDLLEVFEDVRREIAARGQELCLFVEDLVLLHGIDKQLAQALTIPANSELCKLRAVIAVTDGYLTSVDTFADRGLHFSINFELPQIEASDLRDMVGRYLNVGRLSVEELVAGARSDGTEHRVPNACLRCPDRQPCHDTFGSTSNGHGLYPFNAPALDRLIRLANPRDFHPRNILRHVIRAPLEVAQEELPERGTFPSDAFAKVLDGRRINVPVEVRNAVRKQNHQHAPAELSVRAFYSATPPELDPAARRVAEYFGVTVSDLEVDGEATPEVATVTPASTPAKPVEVRGPKADAFELWASGETMNAGTAHPLRVWICETVASYINEGPYGVTVRKKGGKFPTWRIGSHLMRTTDVVIDKAQGNSAITPKIPFSIAVTDENALILRGINAAAEGRPLDVVDQGAWYFAIRSKISRYADRIVEAGRVADTADLTRAASLLTIFRNAMPTPGATVREALPALFGEPPVAGAAQAAQSFLRASAGAREQALLTIRDHATAAKGTGSLSIFDIGPLHKAIRATLATRSFTAYSDSTADESLRSLQSRLDQAATRVWTEIGRLMARIDGLIDPDEDLPTAMKSVGQLLEQCRAAGRLPSRDSYERYESLAVKITPSVVALYRKLRATIHRSAGRGELWDVIADPTPDLQPLLAYAEEADRLLSGLESATAAHGHQAEAADVDGLVTEFRGLADALDQIVTREG
ncbi:AAA family ATPase [Actinokineospora sp. NPDC004072]